MIFRRNEIPFKISLVTLSYMQHHGPEMYSINCEIFRGIHGRLCHLMMKHIQQEEITRSSREHIVWCNEHFIYIGDTNVIVKY